MVNTTAQAKVAALQANIERVIRGKPEAVKFVIVTLLARGHLLIEDVPGVGKTTLAQALARSLACTFRRIQFTSDLLPSDIIGVTVYNQQTREFEFKIGPLFANVVLADEINRTTPKTQSSLLEAMNDGQVSVDSRTYPLPRPFIVMATQNPIEYQGTYPLPESQLDRFMMRIRLGYPDMAHEREILSTIRLALPAEGLTPVLNGEDVLALQTAVERVRMEGVLLDYLLAIVSATRTDRRIALGVSPRGAMFLHRAAQALAFVEGRDYGVPDDVKRLAPMVLPHRMMLHAGEPGSSEADRVIGEIVSRLPVPL